MQKKNKKYDINNKKRYTIEFNKNGLEFSELANQCEISYSTVYELLEKLIEKGLIKEKWTKIGHKKIFLKRKNNLFNLIQ